MITENLSTLKINKLSQEQYNREYKAGNIDEKAFYLTPYENDTDVDLENATGILPIKNGGTGNSDGYIRTGQDYGSDIGSCATVEGAFNIGSGNYSHVEGRSNIASGKYSHVEGYNLQAIGESSHAEGQSYHMYQPLKFTKVHFNTDDDNYYQNDIYNCNFDSSPEIDKLSQLLNNIDRYGFVSIHKYDSSSIEDIFEIKELIVIDESTINLITNEFKGVSNEDYTLTFIPSNTCAIGFASHFEGVSKEEKYDVLSCQINQDNLNEATLTIEIIDGFEIDNIKSVDVNYEITQYITDGDGNVIDSYTFEEYITHNVTEAVFLSSVSSNWYSIKIIVDESISEQENFKILMYNWKLNMKPKKSGAIGDGSHREGCNTLALGNYSHAEGYYTDAYGDYSHANGYKTKAEGEGSHSEGSSSAIFYIKLRRSTSDTYEFSSYQVLSYIIEPNNTVLISNTDEEILITSVNYDNATLTLEKPLSDVTTDEYSYYRLKLKTNALGDYSHTEGYRTYTHNDINNDSLYGYQHAEGCNTVAIHKGSHSEGSETAAIGSCSHAEGSMTESIGDYSHAEGYSNIAGGKYSHAEGCQTIAYADHSHAEGFRTTTHAKYSHTEGLGTNAYKTYQHVEGKHNIENNEEEISYAHIIGNGASTSSRSNAHTLDWNGNATFAGSVTGSGADYAEYFEWFDGNPNNEDRIGLIVTLDGEKIRLANSEDDILGVVSGTAMVVGDNVEWEWKDKYLRDDYGRVITEMVEEFEYVINHETNETEKISTGFFPHKKLNPNYDSSQKYKRRSDRPEWSTVGLIGKLHVTDDGTCVVGKYATVGNNGVATKSETKTNMKVMKRISDTVVLVFMK